MTSHQFSTASAALAFVLAGNATLTLVSKRTGARFTYRVRALRGAEGKASASGPFFVSVLSGASNESDYSFLGTIFVTRRVQVGGSTHFGPVYGTVPSAPKFVHGRAPKCRISEDAPSARAFAWAISKLVAGDLPESVEIWHEGRCGKCGRKLTVPESIASGIGPVCEESVAA